MKKSLLLTFCAVVFANFFGNSQNSTYVDRVAGGSPIYVRAGVQGMPFLFTPSNFDDTATVDFRHNHNLNTGIGGSIGKLGFSLSVRARKDFIENSYAPSTYTDFEMNFPGRKRLVELSWRRNKGYTDIGIEDYDTTWNSTLPYPSRDDIQVTQFNINATRFYNTNYSYSAAFNFREIQKKSAATWLLYHHFRYQRTKGSADFIHPLVQENYNEFGTIDRLRFWSLGMSPGVAATAVWNGFYISPLASMGLSMQFQKFRTETNERSKVVVSPSAAAKLALGFNSEYFFLGVTSHYELNATRLTDVWNFTYYYGAFLNVGFRF